jgi:hypothetical protein
MVVRVFSYTIFFLLFFASCREKVKNTLFESMPASKTGIDFVNSITDTDTLNILDYLYYYNGAGVTTGDINNDGLVDIYFVSNSGPNKLYLNKGNFVFEDITTPAGVAGSGEWNTGVNMVDINNDGYLDIYLCSVGAKLISTGKQIHGKNQLYINNGNNTFSEQAAAFGLDYQGYSTQTIFFDYDRDGDNDMFLLNHSVHSNENYGDTSIRSKTNAESGDRLFRNDANKFVDVTAGSGIISSSIGYGLGVSVGDFNHDGWDDIYVANDFHENDYYYINKGDGSFKESIRDAFGHTSRFSMGTEAADMNNDGWLDILTTDMLPEDEKNLKSSNGDDPLEIYNLKMSYGYYHQYARNAFQLNTGRGEYFSDFGLLAGIAATDWTWSPLAADFDNDGIKDLFFSNGIMRRLTNLDYIRFYADASLGKALKNSRKMDKSVIEMLPKGEAVNYFFKGTDSLLFSDQTSAWGIDEKTLSTGSAYADLDNDGDIDLIINNINSPAGILRNRQREAGNQHYLSILLRGDSLNRFALGSKVYLKIKDSIQFQQLYPVRGFMSASEMKLHFGLNQHTSVDTILIIWPDGSKKSVTGVKADQLLTIEKETAYNSIKAAQQNQSYSGDDFAYHTPSIFRNITEEVGVGFIHKENDYIDFVKQPLMPHMLSALGPKCAVADVNNDGLDDFFIGGAKSQSGELFIQTIDGRFYRSIQEVFTVDSLCEDVDAVFFDADGDVDADLYVVSGGGEYKQGAAELADRLYLNDGKGNFTKSTGLPLMQSDKSCVTVADIDNDGDKDIFVGSRQNEQSFGSATKSYLLINDGRGNFKISTEENAKGLQSVGMVCAAAFADLDKDGDEDLVLVGDWMSPVIFENNKGQLTKATGRLQLPDMPGWWQTVVVTDLNNDGFPDIVAGNYGLNSKLKANPQSPLLMYLLDYDNNGINEQILAYKHNGEYYTFLGKDELEHQIPSIKKKFLKYDDFAGKTTEEIFGTQLSGAQILKATALESVVFYNDGKGNFGAQALPLLAQSAPVFAILPGDYNRDGKMDLLTGGNFSGVLPYEGRYDAMVPSVIWGNGELPLGVHLPFEKSLLLHGEVRDIRKLRIGTKDAVLITRNNAAAVILSY